MIIVGSVVCCTAPTTLAQNLAELRKFGGWAPVKTPGADASNGSSPIQRAYYQASEQLSDNSVMTAGGDPSIPPALPELPSYGAIGTPPSNYPGPSSREQGLGTQYTMPDLPSGVPGYGSNARVSQPPNQLATSPPTRLSDAAAVSSRGNSSVAPRQQFGAASGPTGYGSVVNDSFAEPSSLQQTPRSPPTQAATYQMPSSQSPHSIPGQLASTGGADSQGLRQIERTQAQSNAQPDRYAATQVAHGYPYVSPPPESTGHYPTLPLNTAFFQNAAYQRNLQQTSAPATPAQTVSTGGNIASQTQVNAPVQNQYLPQFVPTSYQCVPSPSVPSTGAVPGSYVPPTFTQNIAPGVYASNNAGYTPLFSLGQENYNVQIGRGVIGQPTVYVPGQPIRNFLRYLSP
ncbi:MAG: hypothetical protein KC443_08420 [Anaerolineales bacterium]|nr:hypothetical protein [Anaerolineales bacterium]